MPEAKPCAVLFDYDDTLVQTRECKYQAIIALAERHYGATLAPAEIDAHWGIPYLSLFENLFGRLDSDVARVIERYEALNDEFPVRAYDDAVACLESLLQHGFHVGVVTSAGAIVRRQMEQVGIPLARLVLVQTALDTQHHKPDPRVFAPALLRLNALGVAADAVTYVGDSLSDLRAARGAELAFVGIHGRTTNAAEFERAGARSVESLSALLSVLPC